MRVDEGGAVLGEVTFARRDGSTSRFLLALDAVVDYWRARMSRDAEWLLVRHRPG